MASEIEHHQKQGSTKLPTLMTKSHIHKTESHEISPLIIKDSTSLYVSSNEESNDVKIYKSENTKIQSINSSGNEPPLRNISHKQINVPVLKQRKQQNEILNPNIKRIQRSTFQKKIRYDKNGIEINHKNKKNVKVTFKDEIEGEEFCEIIDIENFKEYMKGGYGKAGRKDSYVRAVNATCSCNIF